jgi:hypothetical protein
MAPGLRHEGNIVQIAASSASGKYHYVSDALRPGDNDIVHSNNLLVHRGDLKLRHKYGIGGMVARHPGMAAGAVIGGVTGAAGGPAAIGIAGAAAAGIGIDDAIARRRQHGVNRGSLSQDANGADGAFDNMTDNYGSTVAEGDQWRTINGVHVLIDAHGNIKKGPKDWIGKHKDSVGHPQKPGDPKRKEGRPTHPETDMDIADYEASDKNYPKGATDAQKRAYDRKQREQRSKLSGASQEGDELFDFRARARNRMRHADATQNSVLRTPPARGLIRHNLARGATHELLCMQWAWKRARVGAY